MGSAGAALQRSSSASIRPQGAQEAEEQMAKTKPVSWSLQKPSCRFVKCDAGVKHGSSTAQG